MQKREVEALTALRGIAALWVVLYHYSSHVERLPAQAVISQGTLAVDIFFTLSGFILVYVYRDGLNTVDFLVKRFARLYPVHLVTLLAVIAMTLVGRAAGVQLEEGLAFKDLITHFLALHSTGVNDGLVLNYPSWSISAEFLAYLAFPILVPLVMNRDLRRIVPTVLIFFGACVWIADLTGRPLPTRTYDFSLIRILPEFLLGMLAARLCLEGRVSPKLCALIAVALLVAGLGTGERLLSILAAPFLISALFLFDWRVPRAIRYLGLISYSLYMVHAPVERVSFAVMEMFFDEGPLPTWTILIATSLALASAVALYHLVEEPGRRFVMSSRRRLATGKPEGGQALS